MPSIDCTPLIPPLSPDQVVALPLTDVSPEMGPTEMCPGKKLRFYRGYRCQDHLRMATTAGTIAIFDYKTLHRGPGNAHATKERAMVSMVPPPRPPARPRARLPWGLTSCNRQPGVLQDVLPQHRGGDQPRHLAAADAPPAAILGTVHVAPAQSRCTVCRVTRTRAWSPQNKPEVRFFSRCPPTYVAPPPTR